nr:hypothetical protein T14B4.1 - Caenorhabditis elegans [Caenorhabditis elegans]
MGDAESEIQIRAYWNRRAENVDGDESVADFLAYLRIVDQNEFQIALPTLCIVAAKDITDSRKKEFEGICADVLLDAESSRPSRRAVIACLKEFCSGSAWTDFYTLVEALEEPQFHIIRPVLPRFDTLLNSVRDGKLNFQWLKVALFRAMLHTNGWIRVWAIEKSISIDASILKDNDHVITSLIIPNLNNNDVFWRNLEKGRMDAFLIQLGSMFNSIRETPDFIRNLLVSIELMSCPTAIFFVVSALRSIAKTEILNSDDVPLLRRVVLKARYIPHKSIRIITIRNLIVFYAKITRLDGTLLHELSNLISYISQDATSIMIDAVFKEIQNILDETSYIANENQDENVFHQTFGNDSKNLGLHAKMWWISMGKATIQKERMLSRLQLEVSELLGEKPTADLTSQLFLLKERPENMDFSSDVLECMKNDLGEYILTQIISNKGSKRELELLQSLHIPLFNKYCSHLSIPFALAVVQVLGDLKTCESATVCLTFFNALVENVPEERYETLAIEFYKYLGGNEVIGMKRMKKSVEEYETKEFNQISATLHSLRLSLLNKFIKDVDENQFLSECVEQLDVASAFPVKQQLCLLIARFIKKCTDHKLALDCIRASASIVNEEKKSLNSLPALRSFFHVALSGPQSDPVIAQESIELLEAQLAVASQSTPIALILVDAITKYQTNLDVNWAPFIVKLALFGPVPKKESRVISYAYSMIFEEEGSYLKKDQVERLDEVVQTARFKAVLLALKLSTVVDGNAWRIALIEEIFKASAIMDQSSSRSFGLSMAHRQKTRAVELLHLLALKIEDQESASKVFDFCINCVVDPCQQFSIKLIVEWTLAMLCVKFEKLFEKLIDEEFEVFFEFYSFGNHQFPEKYGFPKNWLNLLMAQCPKFNRSVAPKFVDSCLDKVIVWCTAQNFPVRCTALAAARLMFSTFDKDRRKKWRIVKAITILSEIAKRTGMPPEETIPNNIIMEMNNITHQIKSMNEDQEFLSAPSEVYSALSKNASCAPSMENEDVGEEESPIEFDEQPENTNASTSFQRKIVKENELNDGGISLIVVASLVDKPNNLGGICRTSEIFGVDTLVVADVLVAQDANFKALSMSSENWQKIEGVKRTNLLPYLQNLRANGYTVIAAEQTTDSVMMHDFVFPKKAVIVMGDEKEGVPVNLLRAVDQTVEIKQVGHTRSLNVHVTAALMIAKFAEQVRFDKN